MRDIQHVKIKCRAPEMEHKYGPNIHILSDPFLLSQLARLCSPQGGQPLITELLTTIYRSLVAYVVNQEFPRKFQKISSRMAAEHPEAVFEGEIIDAEIPVVTVSLARAGILPSQLCYLFFNYVLNPSKVRQDHIFIGRTVDQKQKVTGADLMASKIGGTIEGAIVFIPDPMGATGSSVISVLDVYKSRVAGKPMKFIAAHLIITPEYIRNVLTQHPDCVIYAVRLDRGLSSKKVLESLPGTHWDQEKGLNHKQYIVPGGGGFGEILNNSFV